MSKIERLGEKFTVEIRVQKGSGRIHVYGLETKVYKAMTDILGILQSAQEEEKERAEAKWIKSTIQWYYMDPVSRGILEYDDECSLEIERAYRSNQPTARIQTYTDDDSGDIFTIDFNVMEKYNKDKSEVLTVLRKDKTKGTWYICKLYR